jgi:hypothetical protein
MPPTGRPAGLQVPWDRVAGVPNGTSAAGAGSGLPGTAATTWRTGLAGAALLCRAAECPGTGCRAAGADDVAGPLHAAVMQAPARTTAATDVHLLIRTGCGATMKGS